MLRFVASSFHGDITIRSNGNPLLGMVVCTAVALLAAAVTVLCISVACCTTWLHHAYDALHALLSLGVKPKA